MCDDLFLWAREQKVNIDKVMQMWKDIMLNTRDTAEGWGKVLRLGALESIPRVEPLWLCPPIEVRLFPASVESS